MVCGLYLNILIKLLKNLTAQIVGLSLASAFRCWVWSLLKILSPSSVALTPLVLPAHVLSLKNKTKQNILLLRAKQQGHLELKHLLHLNLVK